MAKVHPFIKKLVEARIAKGWSQTRLSLELGYTPTAANAIEKGKAGLTKERYAQVLRLFPELKDVKPPTLSKSYGARREKDSIKKSAVLAVIAKDPTLGIQQIINAVAETGIEVSRPYTQKIRATVRFKSGNVEPRSVTKVKRVLDNAARMAGAVGTRSAGERTVPWSYARSLISLIKNVELKDDFTTFLRAARGNSLSLSDVLNDIESL